MAATRARAAKRTTHTHTHTLGTHPVRKSERLRVTNNTFSQLD